MVIPPPVDALRYTELHRIYYGQKVSRKIISIGRFAKEKNHLEQVDIIASLSQQNPNWQLVMIGTRDSGQRERLDEMKRLIRTRGIEMNVRILENVTQDELNREIGTARYFLHTNHRDAFPLSVREAILSGCLPVVPREGGTGEIVSSELTFSEVS